MSLFENNVFNNTNQKLYIFLKNGNILEDDISQTEKEKLVKLLDSLYVIL